MGNSIKEIKKCAPKAIVKNGFSISGTSARTIDSHEHIKNWLHKILLKIKNLILSKENHYTDLIK